jgi:hypothetical protein
MWCRGTGATNDTHSSFGLLYPSSDNCKVGLYCDTNSTVCIQQRTVGARCTADKECVSYNCLPDQICGVNPSNPRHFPVWVYVIIGIGIFGGEHKCPASYALALNVSLGMIATLVFLFIVHGRQREDEREKRLQYWREQVKKIILFWKRGLGLTICLLVECLPPKHLANARNSSQLLIRCPRKCIPAVCTIWHYDDDGGRQCPDIRPCCPRIKEFWTTSLFQRGQ